VAAEALASYMKAEQEAFADQEAKLNKARSELVDGRVDCVLYFLPTNARIGESDLDFTVINALAAYAPVIPLMCKVRAGSCCSSKCSSKVRFLLNLRSQFPFSCVAPPSNLQAQMQ
jgi:hypothetical protein